MKIIAEIADRSRTHTLNSLIASYCNGSADNVVSGELIASLECKRVGCFHSTQSKHKNNVDFSSGARRKKCVGKTSKAIYFSYKRV